METRAKALSTLPEIERAITALRAQEVEELYLWLDRHHPQPIDARIASDLAAGHLDNAIGRALDHDWLTRKRNDP